MTFTKNYKKDYMLMNIIKNNVDLVQEEKTIQKNLLTIVGIDLIGNRQIIGISFEKEDDNHYYLDLLEEIKARGVEDILYVSLDGLSGLKEAINDIYSNTNIQRCIVHLTRNLYGICPRKEAKEIMRDFKKIYTSNTLEQARLELQNFIEKYKKKTAIVKK